MPVSASASTTYEFFGPVQRYTLSNDMTVLLNPVEHSRSLSAQVWIRAGSSFEDDKNNGLSHLLEHMMFKGTEKYSAKRINHLIESVGGRQNAATSKEYTKYYVTLPAHHWERSLKLLEQMSFHATIPRDEFLKERKVVLSELARYQDNPRRSLWLKFIPQLYGDHPYGRLTIGSRQVLEEVTHDQLKEYYNRYYQPENMTLVVSGKFDEEPVKERIEELFGQEESGSEPVEPPQFDTNRPDTSNIEREVREANQAYGLIGTTGYPFGSGKTIAIDLLMTLLGGGKDSYLYERLVLEKNLASSVSASFWTLDQSGPLIVRFQTDRQNLDATINAIQKTVRQITNNGISSNELKRAKTKIKTDFIYKAQTAQGQANQLGYWETLGSLEYLEGYVDEIESINTERLERMSKQLLVDQGWKGNVIVPEQ